MNACKSKVMRCSRYGNRDRMHVILKGEPLEEVDVFVLSTWRMEVVKGMWYTELMKGI